MPQLWNFGLPTVFFTGFMVIYQTEIFPKRYLVLGHLISYGEFEEMFLKSLEMMGFKSFGHKTVFEFQPGITAIVGPNGSGKSNICDAIKWALGEQSAKALRGNKMAEVIFAGSNQIRPSAFAQVRLVLNNESRKLPLDYSEISIGRQLFRSGESNYIINGNKSLLNDIKEMLMDTGIGKEGYSVISQGDIEDIIFQRAQSRRALIEEAAGITKFKHRKSNTLQKLENTRGNIVRLKDIVAEIENQMGPLAEQAEKARKYQELSNEICGLEIDLVLFDLSKLYTECENFDAMRRGIAAKISEIQKFLSEIDLKKSQARERIQGLEEILKANQAKAKETARRIEEVKAQSSKFKEDVGACQARKQAIIEEIATIDELLMTSSQEIKDAEEILKDEESREILISGNIAEIEANIKKAQDELETHLKAASLDKESSFQMAVRMAEKKNRIASSSQNIQMLQRQVEKGSFELDGIKGVISKLEAEKERIETQISSLDHEISEDDKKLTAEKARLFRLEKDLEKAHDEASGISDQIKILQTRKNMLDELRNHSESGIFRGVREALSLKNRELPGICGIVGDLIKVPKGYELAFETSLGASIQDIVTKDAETAQKAIAYLKEKKAGRATFLPLDLIQPPSRLEKPMVKGCLGVALDLVEYDAKFYAVMNHLFGRILIFDNLDNAVAFSRSNRNFNRIVTLDGDVVRSSGAMTGGAEGQKGLGLLSRKREIEDLEEKLRASIAREKKVSSLLTAMKNERETLQVLTRQLEDSLSRKRQSLEFFKQGLEKTNTEISQKQQALSGLEGDRQDVESQLKKWQSVLQEAQAELAQLEEQNRELTQRLQALAGKEDSIQARMTELKSLLSDERMKIVQIAERKKAVKKEIDSAAKRRKDASERKGRAEKEVTRLDCEIKRFSEQIAALGDEISQLEEQKRSEETDLEKIQQDYRAVSKEIESLDHTYLSRAKMEESSRNKLAELDIKLAEIKTHIQNKENILTNEFQFDFAEINVNCRKYENREELEGKIADLRSRREALEPVNPLAIDEYEKTRERYEFLNNQIKDMTEAANSLEQVIAEIEKISSERFIATFNQIDTAFADIFQILFPGGTGHLKLADDTDPLNSNVEIVCQLPGKKLGTLELFSGGEKAMISIALLFAILQVKPPAFCILDEVEASLDESNVRRFTRLLRSFADKTQFIVITHNKETMQAVDVIYGVTLEKNGISRPISIRLEDQDRIREFTMKKPKAGISAVQ